MCTLLLRLGRVYMLRSGCVTACLRWPDDSKGSIWGFEIGYWAYLRCIVGVLALLGADASELLRGRWRVGGFGYNRWS